VAPRAGQTVRAINCKRGRGRGGQTPRLKVRKYTKSKGPNKAGNVVRAIRRRIEPFIVFLRKNVQRCKASPTPFVPFVPYRNGSYAEDLGHVAEQIRKLFGRKAASRPASFLATCLIIGGLFGSKRSVKVISRVPVPFTKAYGKRLLAKLLKSLAKGDPLFNNNNAAWTRRTFKRKTARKTTQSARKLARIINTCRTQSGLLSARGQTRAN